MLYLLGHVDATGTYWAQEIFFCLEMEIMVSDNFWRDFFDLCIMWYVKWKKYLVPKSDI